MLRKKNYKEEDHFNQYYSVYIPRSNGTKYTLFYKRYRPAKAQLNSVYEVVNNKQQQAPQSEYPVDRTLEVLSFDGNLDIARVFFKKIGKVRKFINGETQFRGKQAYYCIVIFKFEFDLVKCFRDDFFQELISRQNTEEKAGEEEKEEYQKEMITTYMQDELKQVGKLEQLHSEGFNPITNKLGQFRVDYEANQKLVDDLPQTRRKIKKEAKANRQNEKNQ